MIFQAEVYTLRITDRVRPFYCPHRPWWLAISMKICEKILSQGILFPETCMLDYSKKRISGTSFDMKEKMISNYFFHYMFLFSIYVNMGEFEFLMWLNPKEHCLGNSQRVCAIITGRLVSRRKVCISWPSSINLP